MAVANQLTTIHSCETGTDAVTGCVLTGADSNFGNATGEYVEGSYGYIFDLDIETHNCIFTPSSSINLTNQVVWLWMRFLTESFLGTWASGGVKCRLSDGTNWSEWYLGGAGRWGSSWNRVPFYTGSTPDAISGTLNLAAVTVITYYFTGTVKSKLPENVFIDFLQYGAIGSGIKITGGGLGTEEDLDDVVGDDVTVAAGMIEKVDGVFFMNGPWNFGDTATNNIYFKDLNEIIVTKDHYRTFTTGNRGTAESLVSSDHYQLNVQNYAAGTGNFQLGEAQGGRGVSGCTFKTGGNRKLQFDFNDTDIDLLKLYACTFIDCSIFAFPTALSGSEVSDCVWNGCGEINVNTFKFRYCNFVNATTNGIQVDSTSFDVEDCNFINPTTAGIELTVAGPYDFTDLVFVGTSGSGPYDVNNTYGSAITVNNEGTSNGQYYTGSTVTFQGSVTVEIKVIDENLDPIENAQTSVWKLSDNAQIMNEDTLITGIASETYTGATPVDVVIKVRKSDDLDDPRYFPYSGIDVIASGTGLKKTIMLTANPFI